MQPAAAHQGSSAGSIRDHVQQDKLSAHGSDRYDGVRYGYLLQSELELHADSQQMTGCS